VLDPYAGSGPVVRACRDLGRRCIAVEIVEAYCAVIVRRLWQLALPLDHGS
jgi:DNA modification methylase